MSLIPGLPVSYQPALCQQDKQIERIEARLHRFVHDEDMGEVLFPAARLILALKDQDAARFQHPMGLTQHITVEAMKGLLIGKYTETTVYEIPFSLR